MMNDTGFSPHDFFNQWQKYLRESMTPPHSVDQMRRQYLKSLKTNELWEHHNEIIEEIKSRGTEK